MAVGRALAVEAAGLAALALLSSATGGEALGDWAPAAASAGRPRSPRAAWPACSARSCLDGRRRRRLAAGVLRRRAVRRLPRLRRRRPRRRRSPTTFAPTLAAAAARAWPPGRPLATLGDGVPPLRTTPRQPPCRRRG
ncbi:MAG: hypothetical protein U0470_02510 [Anaerolineae bacterium]